MRPKRLVGRGSRLLPLVYVSSLMLVALTAGALAFLGAGHVTDAAVRATVAADQAAVREFVSTNVTAAELAGEPMTVARQEALNAALSELAARNEYGDLTLLSSAGTIQARSRTGLGVVSSNAMTAIADGLTTVSIEHVAGAPTSATDAVLVEAVPVTDVAGRVIVFEIRRDASSIVADAGTALRDVLLVVGSAAIVLAGLLFAIFRSAGIRLRRQQDALIESTRRDSLTGLLNHGTAFEMLERELERARGDGGSVGIALVDIDNFSLLNDVHRSPVGDEALLAVTAALRKETAAWRAVARFGPDEFLAIAVGTSARGLPDAMRRVLSSLAEFGLTLEDGRRLPVTVSVGITYFPFHASSVTELLSAATIALGDAKAAGGNEISIADAWDTEPRPAQTTFDVLQGLVLAIDRKDRYTRLHSEDVTYYALFLARTVGLPEEDLAALRMAALLHDVGKIGIPDDILRKPGRLTPYEYDIIKQHVALGDLIVRDVPDIDTVRAGVRHHHEQWDGSGYLAGLAGTSIPLIARVLAVADAFSAMTTTRPYRKALSFDHALDELRSVAGTQLDPGLTEAFVAGMESDPTAPLPGATRDGSLLWTPTVRAA
jgi:diguanylate cyclase (GGDEF)-like protein/putative nucleotidyltransferase with HDIG domain